MKRYNMALAKMLLGGLCGLLFHSCVDNPMEGEQYTKKIVLIGAQAELQEKQVKYGSNGEFFVTAYCGGTLIHEEDIAVTLGEAHQVNIDNYNYKNVLDGEDPYQALPKDWYEVPSYTSIIKGGERYVRFPIRIKPESIDADARYLLPLKIVDTKPYPVNEQADSVLLVSIKMVNDYSGNYMMKGTEYAMKDGVVDSLSASPIEISRTLTAIDKNTVRFFHKSINEEKENLDANGVTLTVDEASGSVSVKAWKDLAIVEGSGKGTFLLLHENYGVTTRKFTIEYDYTNASSKLMHVSITLETTESYVVD